MEERRPRRRRRKKGEVRSTGEYHGHAKRQSLVTTTGHTLTDNPDMHHPGAEVHSYIVRTDREPGDRGRSVYYHVVEYRGVTWNLPGKVVDQMIRHRKSITEEIQRIQGKEAADRAVREAQAHIGGDTD